MSPEEDAVRMRRAVEVALRMPEESEMGAPSPQLEIVTRGHGEPPANAAAPESAASPASSRASTVRLIVRPADASGRAWAAAGGLAERLRVALGAESIARPLRVAVRLEEPDTRPTGATGTMEP